MLKVICALLQLMYEGKFMVWTEYKHDGGVVLTKHSGLLLLQVLVSCSCTSVISHFHIAQLTEDCVLGSWVMFLLSLFSR